MSPKENTMRQLIQTQKCNLGIQINEINIRIYWKGHSNSHSPLIHTIDLFQWNFQKREKEEAHNLIKSMIIKVRPLGHKLVIWLVCWVLVSHIVFRFLENKTLVYITEFHVLLLWVITMIPHECMLQGLFLLFLFHIQSIWFNFSK